ncbi:MAG: carboxypeptidase-like regulatory domain-containing protein, partial [Chitinophagaceae bacterium]
MHFYSFAVKSIRNFSAVLFILLFICLQTFAQDIISVRGKVMDGDKKVPVSGASIMVKGNTSGTVSDANGEFSLQVPKGSTIVITYTGFQSVEMLAAENMPVINIL